jgi:hypothetical protein
MLAGKWISKMFDPDDQKNILIEKERFSYEFTYNKYFKDLEKILGDYFDNNFESVKYLSSEVGKVKSKYMCKL